MPTISPFGIDGNLQLICLSSPLTSMEKGGSFSLKHHANTIDKIDTKRFVDEN